MTDQPNGALWGAALHIIKAICRIAIGATFGSLCAVALIPALAAFASAPSASGLLLCIAAAVGAFVGWLAPTIRNATGRGLLLVGTCVAALPITATMLAGSVSAEMAGGSGGDVATILGSAIGGIMLVAIAGIIGLIGFAMIWFGLVIIFGKAATLSAAKSAFASVGLGGRVT